MNKRMSKVLGCIAVLLIGSVGVTGCFFGKRPSSQSRPQAAGEIAGDDITQEEIDSFVDLATRYAHYDPDFVVYSESGEPVVPVEGVDYVQRDVKRAVAELYESVEHSPAEDKYVSKNMDVGPASWVRVGRGIVAEIKKKYPKFKSSELYDRWSDPKHWVETGDAIIQEVADSTGQAGKGEGSKEAPDFSRAEAVIPFVVDQIKADAEEFDWDLDFDIAKIVPVIEEKVTEQIDEEWEGIESEEDLVEYVEVYFDDSWEAFREEPTAENIPVGTVVDALRNRNASEKTDDRGIIKAEYYPVSFKPVGRLFYRDTLNEKEKRVYDIAVSMLQNGIFEIECNFGMTQKEVYDVLHCVERDLPEFFYLSFGHVYFENEVFGFSVFIDERIKKIGVDQALSTLKSKTAPAIAAAAKLEKEIDRVKYIVDHMCATVMYDPFTGLSEEETCKRISAHQTLWTAVSEGKTVCAGYAQLFQYYMKMLGVRCAKLVTDGHALDLLELDGECYYMDVTWIDGGESGDYRWFNYNDKLKEAYKGLRVAPDGWADRDDRSARLPAANGSKYFYGNYYDKDRTDESGEHTDKHTRSGDSKPSSVSVKASGESRISQTTQSEKTVRTKRSETTRPSSASGYTVKIEGLDISQNLDIKQIENTLYAEGESFIEAIRYSDMPKGMRVFSYEHSADGEDNYDLLSEYTYEDGTYLRDEFTGFLDLDTIIISSYFTDVALYMLFVGRTEAVDFTFEGDGVNTPELIEISKAPMLVGDKIYIPLEAFLEITEIAFEISE